MTTSDTLHRLASGREAEVYAWGDGAVLRLLRDPAAHERNTRQRSAIEAAAQAGVRVPDVHGAVMHLNRPGLVMERIDGPDLLTVVGKTPWRVLWVAGHTGRAHAALHRVAAPDNLPAVREGLRRSIVGSDRVPDQLRAMALDMLDRLPDGDRLLHGDFHPGNLMLKGAAPVIIDWTNASRGDPNADVARSVLMLKLGDVPPESPLPLRLLAHVGRRVLLGGYLRAYRHERDTDRSLLSGWEVVQAADRLALGIEAERPKLLRLLERHV
jgi:aminoglycoside phosphotransferase (APT) family kinase protein